MKVVLCTLNAKYIHSSIALRYLKSYCEDSSWKIDTIEFTINQPLEDIRTRLFIAQPDVLSFSCYIWNIEIIAELCSDLKALLPECIIVLGGPEVSFDAAELLERDKNVDIVIRGEGEVTLKELLEHLKQKLSLADVDGISYRAGSDIINNHDRRLMADLNAIPQVYDMDLAEFDDRLLYYESSRGCPFNCTYCLSSTFAGVRTFSMERVKDDLRLIMKKGVRTVKFVDRTFNCNEKRARAIMEFILEHNESTKFHFEICADLISDEFMEFLLKIPAGIFSFEIGIQSTYLPALEAVDRSCDIHRFTSNVRQLAEKGNIHLHLDLIAGLPEERYTEFRQSFNQVYNLYPDVIQLGFLKMLKGSPLRRDAAKHGYIYQEHAPYQVLNSNYMSYPEFIKLSNIEKVLERYYNLGEYKTTLKYITEIIYQENAMAFFEAFADYYLEKGWFGQGHTRADECNMLMIFIEEKHSEHREVVNEYLKYDFIINNRHSPLPDRLSAVMPARTKDRLYGLLKDTNFVSKALPELAHLSKYDLSKRVHLEIFNREPTNINSQKTGERAVLFVYPINQRKAERIIFLE
ncbi:MAG: B12-binding domain-containing radical SAM protein [Syntrophomonadaceae bacterium]|nr:B12-binding domain-containing radical SAM protein [Syntrophomonadaceae bacterium]